MAYMFQKVFKALQPNTHNTFLKPQITKQSTVMKVMFLMMKYRLQYIWILPVLKCDFMFEKIQVIDIIPTPSSSPKKNLWYY